MKKPTNGAAQVDAYIAGFPQEVRERLETVRHAVLSAAKGAEEVISYGMPAVKMGSVLVYYAGYDGHIGFYPTASGIASFAEKLSSFTTSRGTVRLPHDKKLPLGLIRDIVRFRMKEVASKKKAR
jgi:uncharacterized protein YdhG (YjbR/CyaY superfamily)